MNKKVKKMFSFDDEEEIKEYFFNSTFLFFIQSLIIALVLYSALTNTDGNSVQKPTVINMTLRVLCCYLFHLNNYGDVCSSFKRLKYLRYYP
jgi:hypothetical protein